MSVSMEVGTHQTGFVWNLIFEYFSNICPETFNFPENMARITGTLHEGRYTFMIISRSVHLKMRNVSDKIVEKIKTHTLCSVIFFFRKSGRLWDNVDKVRYSRAGNRWQYGACALHATYIGYKHTLRICNTCCFSTATVVPRTHLNVTSYVYWESCSFVSLPLFQFWPS